MTSQLMTVTTHRANGGYQGSLSVYDGYGISLRLLYSLKSRIIRTTSRDALNDAKSLRQDVLDMNGLTRVEGKYLLAGSPRPDAARPRWTSTPQRRAASPASR